MYGLFNKWCWENWIPSCERTLKSCFIKYTENQLKMNKRLTVKNLKLHKFYKAHSKNISLTLFLKII